MARSSDVSEALATLQARWGAAAPRRGGEMRGGSDLHLAVEGALARAPMPLDDPDDLDRPDAPDAQARAAGAARRAPARAGARTPTTAASCPPGSPPSTPSSGTGGLPRSATVALRGDALVGQDHARAAGRGRGPGRRARSSRGWTSPAPSIPSRPSRRGVRPEWLVVLTPADLEEALALLGSLLAARTVDLLVVDLPDGRDPAVAACASGTGWAGSRRWPGGRGRCSWSLEPIALGRALAAAVEEASGLRLELDADGLDPAGPGRGGPAERRDRRPQPLRAARAPRGPRDPVRGGRRPGRLPRCGRGCSTAARRSRRRRAAPRRPGTRAPATARTRAPRHRPERPPCYRPIPMRLLHLLWPHLPLRLARSRLGVTGERRHLRLVAARPDRPRRTALDGRDGGRRGPARSGPRRAPGDPARERPPARARGDLPRPRA